MLAASLSEFVKQAWHVFEPGTPLKWSWVLDAICEHVQALLEDRLVRDGRVIRNLGGSLQKTAVDIPPDSLAGDWLGLWSYPGANYADPEFQTQTKDRLL